MTIISKNLRDTARFAQKVAKKLHGGETLALVGELGAGKTTFVKALAKALGVRKRVRSPSFVLMVPHRCERRRISGKANQRTIAIRWLLHVDAYRIKNTRDLEAVGIREYLGAPDTVTVIEWADRVRKLLPHKTVKITFQHGKHPNERTIKVRPFRRQGRTLSA